MSDDKLTPDDWASAILNALEMDPKWPREHVAAIVSDAMAQARDEQDARIAELREENALMHAAADADSYAMGRERAAHDETKRKLADGDDRCD